MIKEIRCPNKAEYLYSWNGELIEGCKEHAKAMIVIGKAIGIVVETKRLFTEKKCMHDNDLDVILKRETTNV